MTEDDIQGWFDDDFRSLYREQVDRVSGPAVFVEVGCWKGKSTVGMARMILESRKPIYFHAVEHCVGSPGDDESHTGCGACEASSERELRDNLAACGVDGTVNLFIMPSLRAAKLSPDGFLDFVFLDGDHREAAVYADCQAWWPKVKAGGTLAGHDRGLPGVDAGVRRFCEEKRLSVTERETVWIISKPQV